jgi:hypothetical protein
MAYWCRADTVRVYFEISVHVWCGMVAGNIFVKQ